MKIKQAKVGHPITGMDSNILDSAQFDLEFNDRYLIVKPKMDKYKFKKLIIFMANLAYVIPFEDEEEKPKKK